MKIDKIIYCCDGAYYHYWETISELTLKVLKIKPVLFFITENEETDFFEDEYGIVKKVKMIPNISSGLQSQIYRMYGTKFFNEEVCLISDIDMILFNLKWLTESINEFDNDSMTILNSDAYDVNRVENYNSEIRYAMCYLVGKGKTFNKILNTDRNFQDFLTEVNAINRGWDSDEIFFTQKLLKTNDITINEVKRGYSSYYYAPGRIEKYMFESMNDKNCPGGSIHKLNLNGTINYDSFIDCHCWRFGTDLLKKIKNDLLIKYN